MGPAHPNTVVLRRNTSRLLHANSLNMIKYLKANYKYAQPAKHSLQIASHELKHLRSGLTEHRHAPNTEEHIKAETPLIVTTLIETMGHSTTINEFRLEVHTLMITCPVYCNALNHVLAVWTGARLVCRYNVRVT